MNRLSSLMRFGVTILHRFLRDTACKRQTDRTTLVTCLSLVSILLGIGSGTVLWNAPAVAQSNESIDYTVCVTKESLTAQAASAVLVVDGVQLYAGDLTDVCVPVTLKTSGSVIALGAEGVSTQEIDVSIYSDPGGQDVEFDISLLDDVIDFHSTGFTVVGTICAISSTEVGRCPSIDDIRFEKSIHNLIFTVGIDIDVVLLPEATGGVGTVGYSVSPALPAGLTFNPSSRSLTGTPTSPMASTEYTYTATDEADDSASLSFNITVLEAPDTSPAFESSSLPDQTYRVNEDIEVVTLPAASGGVGTVSYSLSPALPSGLTFDPSSRSLTGTPTSPMASTEYTYTATDEADDSTSLSFNITVLEELDVGPTFEGGSVPDQTYHLNEHVDVVHLPRASGGSGPVTYDLMPQLPAGLVFDPASVTISGVAAQTMPATDYTLTAQDPAGNTSEITFSIEVTGQTTQAIQHQEAATDTLAAVASAALSNVTSNIGVRFSAPSTGTSVSLGGHALTPANSSRQSWNEEYVITNAPSFFDDPRPVHTTRTGDLGAIGNFEIALGLDESNPGAGSRSQLTVWGRADFQSFEDDREPGVDTSAYDGQATAGYVGVDYSTGGGLLAGVAVSSISAEADYAFLEGAGEMEVELYNLHPYLRVALGPRTEAWTIVGYGQGQVEDLSDGERSDTDLTVWMASAGVRHGLYASEVLTVDALADASYASMETEEGVHAIAGLSAQVSRGRIGTEAGYTLAQGDASAVVAYLEVAARHDNSESLDGWGVEVSPSILVSDYESRFTLEARARMLAHHSVGSYSESGISVTASVQPGSGGEGLSLSLSPQWGDPMHSGNRNHAVDPVFSSQGASGDPELSMASRMAYGIPLGIGVIAPFWDFLISESNGNRNRLGTRYVFGPGASLELAGNRRDSGTDSPDYGVTLSGRLRF